MEPAFAWWVPFTLKKRTSIIAAVNARYHKRTHKFGIRLPKSVKEAYSINRENDDTLWKDAIQLEINFVRVTFKLLNGKEKVPPTYQYIDCHLVFDVKIENFRRKARFVAGGTHDRNSSGSNVCKHC
jgi:hypothetical protein